MDSNTKYAGNLNIREDGQSSTRPILMNDQSALSIEFFCCSQQHTATTHSVCVCCWPFLCWSSQVRERERERESDGPWPFKTLAGSGRTIVLCTCVAGGERMSLFGTCSVCQQSRRHPLQFNEGTKRLDAWPAAILDSTLYPMRDLCGPDPFSLLTTISFSFVSHQKSQ